MTRTPRRPLPLETISVAVGGDHLEVWEQAIAGVCYTVGLFLDEEQGNWRVEGVKSAGEDEEKLATLLALAHAATGETAMLVRRSIAAEGWIAATQAAFPEQVVDRFVIRGTHLPVGRRRPERITLTLDAGAAFGSGEHASTRGCLRALTLIAHRRPRYVLDLGTGSGILAMAAAHLLRRPVLATDIDPWSLRIAKENTRRNRLFRLIRIVRANGWHHRLLRGCGRYDLVFANILARPLCTMAAALATRLAPGGTAILSGLLLRQARQVLAAHRRAGLVLEKLVPEHGWATLVLRKPYQAVVRRGDTANVATFASWAAANSTS